MKYIYVCLLMFIVACNKNNEEFKYFGTATALFNGKTWKASKVRCSINYPCYKGKLGFSFYVYNNKGLLRESLIFQKIPAVKGKYILGPVNYNDPLCQDTTAKSGYVTAQDDGDVLLDSYNAIPSTNNFFTIEDYNERTKELRGSFAVTFKIFSRQDPNSPDTIRVTNGKFYTRILE